jgi:cytochrome c-type biogenesis protein
MADMTIFVAFAAGLVSFLNPCVQPLVPGFLGYLSGTVPGDSGPGRWNIFRHSVFFVLGFSVVFALVGVLLGSALESASFAIRTWLGRLSGVLIILFGGQLVGILKIRSFDVEKKFSVSKGNFSPYVATFFFGAAFGLSWTPCVGLILGSVLALAISRPAASFILLMSYALGMGLPFLAVGFFSSVASKLIQKMGRFLVILNKVAGVFLIMLGIFLLSVFIRANPFPASQIPAEMNTARDGSLAVELSVSDGFINAEPPALKDLLGKKVILLDFWRFGCLHCQEMVPFIEAWHKKYKDEGLMVISIHSPELIGEKDAGNVRAAVRMLGITYPVLLDNDHRNLSMYNVIYWPTLVLIDASGRVAARHIGAGGYKEIEAEIVSLLEKLRHGQ